MGYCSQFANFAMSTHLNPAHYIITVFLEIFIISFNHFYENRQILYNSEFHHNVYRQVYSQSSGIVNTEL